jgi:hypothetical protein
MRTKHKIVGTNVWLREQKQIVMRTKYIWFGEQKQWLGEQKPIVLGTKNYCYGNKTMIVGTITSDCGK